MRRLAVPSCCESTFCLLCSIPLNVCTRHVYVPRRTRAAVQREAACKAHARAQCVTFRTDLQVCVLFSLQAGDAGGAAQRHRAGAVGATMRSI